MLNEKWYQPTCSISTRVSFSFYFKHFILLGVVELYRQFSPEPFTQEDEEVRINYVLNMDGMDMDQLNSKLM